MLIARQMSEELRKGVECYPVVTITGPRQSGKTTLARGMFPGHRYVNLEDPSSRRLAVEDPRGFLRDNPPPLIIDEVQRVPELLSYT